MTQPNATFWHSLHISGNANDEPLAKKLYGVRRYFVCITAISKMFYAKIPTRI